MSDDARPVERGDHHLAVGTLDGQEPVLQVAGVVILVHIRGTRPFWHERGVVAEVAVGRQRDGEGRGAERDRGGLAAHPRPVEGVEPSAVEAEGERGAGRDVVGGGVREILAGEGRGGRGLHAAAGILVSPVDQVRAPVEVADRERAVGRGRAVVAAIADDLDGLGGRRMVCQRHGRQRPRAPRRRLIGGIHRGRARRAVVSDPHDPVQEVVAVEVGVVRLDIGRDGVNAGRGVEADARDVELGPGGGVEREIAVVVGVAAVHVAGQAVAADRRADVGGVDDQLRQGEIHQLVVLRLQDALREVPGVDLGLAAEGGEGDPDQGQQAEHREDQDQYDPAPCLPVKS